MEKSTKIIFMGFTLLLIIFATFSTKVSFHDAAEYITIAKALGGISNLDIFSGHSLLYPGIIAPFLKIWPSFTAIKLVNVFWIFLIGLTLLFWLKNEKAFILFAFSPLTWWISIQTTPVLPASFFFLLSFVIFRLEKIKFNKIYSGVALGLSFAFYTPMLIVAFFFVLIYFWGKSFKEFLVFIISFGIGVIPRIIQDYHLFKMPFYSLIRYLGANVLVSMGARSYGDFSIIKNIQMLLLLVIISPLLFKIYKIKFRKYLKEILLVSLTTIVFLTRIMNLKYFFILSPIIILLLTKILTKKEIKWHCIVSIPIIILLVIGFFGTTYDSKITKDLKEINKKFSPEYILTAPFAANGIASYWWENNPKFIWFQDYKADYYGQEKIREYAIKINPKIPLRSNLEILFQFNRNNEERDYRDKNIVLVLRKTEMENVMNENKEILEEFKLNKCYDLLCTYNK